MFTCVGVRPYSFERPFLNSIAGVGVSAKIVLNLFTASSGNFVRLIPVFEAFDFLEPPDFEGFCGVGDPRNGSHSLSDTSSPS
mmetsp:Transcript_32482/g.70086  ORF Transcript_32482/g.70086 Transcript_32482/m.70086 type:complete len:83 (-) Transcript_32482:1124-1372(-)